MRSPRLALGAALGRRIYAIRREVAPGLSFSDAIDTFDVR
jgi:hypothetical protein